jgi:hypothetical protein
MFEEEKHFSFIETKVGETTNERKKEINKA